MRKYSMAMWINILKALILAVLIYSQISVQFQKKKKIYWQTSPSSNVAHYFKKECVIYELFSFGITHAGNARLCSSLFTFSLEKDIR